MKQFKTKDKMLYRNSLYTETVTMIAEECCSCGVMFGIPSDLQRVLKADPSKYFYCPNGHSQHYSKSTADIIKEDYEKKLKQEKQQREQAERDRDSWREMHHKRVQENKKNERKLKRVHNGVCTCCNRSFKNLQQHMRIKHPETLIKS